MSAPANGSICNTGTLDAWDWNTTNSTKNHSIEKLAATVSSDSHETDTIVFLVSSISLAVVIVVGNVLIVLAYRSNSRLQTKANMFLVNLAVSDFLVGIVSLPCWVVVQLLGLRRDDSFYEFFITFDIFSGLTSVLHLTAISIERFLAISKPFLYPSIPSRYYKVTIVFAWILAAIISALRSAIPKPWIKFYIPAVLVIGFLGPLFIIGSMYCGIFKIAKSLILKEPGGDERMMDRQNRKSSKKYVIRKERKVAVTVSIITGLFFVSWLPFYVVLLIGVFCFPGCWPKSPFDVLRVIAFSKWMHYGNSAVNAFVYSFRDKEMRRTFARLLHNRFTQFCIEVKPVEEASTYL
ncbi:beta-1 adrenergic receptor-like [Actinia tenebrosa]|uniref:Beta-1 adrenergic receptor-like n=1 Tax=Actinia tenebrosa TaxID=6105 RepID=A0A6P8IAD8_ACTTE|nr:beta-1 adrenergic receptor-like [Actinia tenebrosa]